MQSEIIKWTKPVIKWTKPVAGRFKCNVGASFSTSLNKVGIRASIRGADGNFVITKTNWLTPIIDVDMAEALDLLFAM